MGETAERGVLIDGARDSDIDPDQLRRAFGLLDEWIAQGLIPGAAALVAVNGRIVGEAYLGLADRARQRPVDSATIWSLASITKPFTAAAVMLLVERGLLALDEQLGSLLPEFLDVPASPFDRRAVLLRHCLAHCSGLPGFSPDNWTLRQAHRPLTDFVGSFGRQPLLFAPGSAFCYSNPGILMAAEVVGRTLAGTLGQAVATPAITGYHPFVQEQILTPLGMTSSSLQPPVDWNERIAWVEQTGQEGTDWEMANSAYYRGLGIPWGGLFSRPRDLITFVDLFLAGGVRRIGLGGQTTGARLLSPATAAEMVSIQFAPPDAPLNLAPELREGLPEVARPSVEWGIGWEVKGQKRFPWSGELTSPGTFSHLGASGTMAWADPRHQLACILLTNRTLGGGWLTDRPRQTLFSNAIIAAAR